MDNLELRIACRPTDNITIDELNDLQKELKNLTENDYVKLRNSLIEFDFSFPFFIWIDTDGRKYIADGHQRHKVIRKMAEEGIVLPDSFPAFEVLAKDKREAKKKLLLLNSRYGKITDVGLTDFLNEPGSEVSFEDIGDLLSYPENDFKHWTNESEGEEKGDKSEREVTCPSCGAKFNPS